MEGKCRPEQTSEVSMVVRWCGVVMAVVVHEFGSIDRVCDEVRCEMLNVGCGYVGTGVGQ